MRPGVWSRVRRGRDRSPVRRPVTGAASLICGHCRKIRGEFDPRVALALAALQAVALVGSERAAAAGAPGRSPAVEVDPTSGLKVAGTVVNKSSIEQVDLLLYAVATKGGKVVAAGRGLIP
ncbi:MAG: hypothetical protein ACKOQ5_07855, partial [Solirubrobacterales bacterium]